MAKINLRGALAGLLIGASALASGCATPQEVKARKVADFYTPYNNVPRTYHIAGEVLETRIVEAKNDRFQIDNKVYVPAHGARFGVYLVVDPEENKKMVEPYTEGFVISGTENMVKSLVSKVPSGSSVVLKLPVKGKSAEYWLTSRNGQEHSVHLEPLKEWGILLPQKSSEQTVK